MNRVQDYFGNPSDDIARARETVAFCFALMRLGRPRDFTEDELDSLESLQSEAVRIFEQNGLRVPWIAPKHKPSE